MKRKIAALAFLLLSTVSVFAFGFNSKKDEKKSEESGKTKLLGKWNYNGTIDLTLKSDNTYIYGCYDYRYPRQITFNTPEGCSDYNIWYETGKYTVSGDKIAFTVEASNSFYNNVSVKFAGDKDYWTFVLEDDGRVTFLSPRWSRTFSRK